MEVKSFGVREKIIAGFLVLIIIFGLNGAYNLVTINASQRLMWEIHNEKEPSVMNLSHLSNLINQNMTYMANLVYNEGYLDASHNALDKLKDMRDVHRKVRANGVFWKTDEEKKLLEEINKNFKTFEAVELKIINTPMPTDSSGFTALRQTYKQELVPVGEKLITLSNTLTDRKETEKNLAENELTDSFGALKNGIFTLGILIIVICIVTSVYTSNSVFSQIKKIIVTVEQLSKGGHPSLIENTKNDEIGQMATGINSLIVGLKQTSEFAENIGKGEFAASYTPLSDEDVLGNSLINMRNNLKKVSDDDKIRNWANEGYAKFSEVLRYNYQDKKDFAYNVIFSLVKYLDANQGMFLTISEDTSEEMLEELAAYAWGRRKYGNETYKRGEGLAGQAWVEKDYIYLTDVPNEYVKITSGIGSATPRCVIVTPLKYNEGVYGVIELAFFRTLLPHEIEFIVKVSESIAAALANASTAYKMKRLLEETQAKGQQLKEQEEEMRQNLEELEATQEDMRHKEKDTMSKLKVAQAEIEQLKQAIEDLQNQKS
ncbi:MAG TPA: MCP four helix bundle domain-containing protein [Cytophagales bacterium]|nr:MCP four helix bundle domain-containing protein [Cytophagales bacterium]